MLPFIRTLNGSTLDNMSATMYIYPADSANVMHRENLANNSVWLTHEQIADKHVAGHKIVYNLNYKTFLDI